MIKFKTTIEKFGSHGEKTGWTYILIAASIAEKMNPGVKKSYRIKGTIDKVMIQGMAILPMGEGDFILPLKADLRKQLGKRKGDTLELCIELDKSAFVFNPDLIACLEDDPAAYAHFNSLAPSHQRYFSKWIDSAKTTATREKRITQAVIALAKGWGYGEMLRAQRE